MVFTSPESFEPAPTATIIHAYNSDGVNLITLSDDEIYKVIKASGANLIGKPSMHPRVHSIDRYIEERGIEISQVEQSLAIEESHASYFWERQVAGKSSYDMACMEVNTCGDSLSPRVLSSFLDCCDYPELVSFVYFAPTPLLKGFKIIDHDSLMRQCFTKPEDCYSRYIIESLPPIEIRNGKMYIVHLYRKDTTQLIENLRRNICRRYSHHTMKLAHSDRKLRLSVNSQQEEYLACAFYDCDSEFISAICNPKVRENDAMYDLEDCFDDCLLSTDTPFQFDHDFDPPGYTGVWVTGGTGYVAMHVTPHITGKTSNFVEFCAYIHPSMWVFDREALAHIMWPLLKLFAPKRAEIHYRIAAKNITSEKNKLQKFIRRRLIGAGYTNTEYVTYYDDYLGRACFHLNIEKR